MNGADLYRFDHDFPKVERFRYAGDGQGWERVPHSLRYPIWNFVRNGLDPGRIIRMVFQNDLGGLMGILEREELPLWREVVRFVYSHAPPGCFGGKATVARWRGLYSARSKNGRDTVSTVAG